MDPRAPSSQLITPLSHPKADINATRAFRLESGRILLQHQTASKLPCAVLDTKPLGSVFFSVYTPETQEHKWISDEVKGVDVPFFYSPSGPLLTQLNDKICFLDKNDEIRVLLSLPIFLKWHWDMTPIEYARCTTPRKDEYVFVSKNPGGLSHRLITYSPSLDDRVPCKGRTYTQYEFLHSISTLTPDLLCASTFDCFHLLDRDQIWVSGPSASTFTPRNTSLQIKQIAGQPSSKFTIHVIDAVSDHEILAYAYGNREDTQYLQVLIKINIKNNTAQELICPQRISYNIMTLSTTPMLFIIGSASTSYCIFDPSEMLLFPIELPEHFELQAVMPDGRLLLCRGREMHIYSHPMILSLFNPGRTAIEDALKPAYIPIVISDLISGYVGGSIILGRSISSFFQHPNIGNPSPLELSQTGPRAQVQPRHRCVLS